MNSLIVDWQIIDTVFFDMDGTLLDLHFDSHFWLEVLPAQYALQNQIGLDEAKKIVSSKSKAMMGQLEWYCIDYWQKILQIDIMQLKTTIKGKVALRPKTFELLNYLKSLKKNLLLVTNAHPDTLEFKMRQVNLEPYFDQMISSHDLGFAKEQPNFWDTLNIVYPFDICSTLFIDDSFSVLEAAQNYGFIHLLGIAKPDSQSKILHHNVFTLVSDFSELIP